MIVKEKHKIVLTDGVFATTSVDFISVPGTCLPFTMEKAGLLSTVIHAAFFSDVAYELGVRIDGSLTLTTGTPGIDISVGHLLPNSILPVAMTHSSLLGAGTHILDLVFRSLGSNQPQGPREWSPRGKPPIQPARLVKTPQIPLILIATAYQ